MEKGECAVTGKHLDRKPGRGWLLLAALIAAVGMLAAAARSQGSASTVPETPQPDKPVTVIPTEPEIPEEPVQEEPVPEEPAWVPVPASDPVEDSYFDDVAFVGDSRTDGFRLYSGLDRGTYFCVNGETVASATDMQNWKTEDGEKISLADAVAAADCGKIYLMLGVNELGWNGTDMFRTHAGNLLQRLKEDHPDAEIVVQSLLPVSAEQDAKGSYVNNQRILVYNQIWMELAEENGCDYVNIAEAVTGEDGCLPADMSFDGVHLNRAGCRAWLDYLRTHSVGQRPAENPDGKEPAPAAP